MPSHVETVMCANGFTYMYDSNRICAIVVLSPVVMTRELVRREPMFSNPETSTSELVKEAPREENGIENGSNDCAHMSQQ